MKNKFKTLGINPTDDKRVIRNAYTDLLKKYHPDTYSGDKSFAINKTQLIITAYKEIIKYIDDNPNNFKHLRNKNQAKPSWYKAFKFRSLYNKKKDRTPEEIKFIKTIRVMSIIIIILIILLIL